LQSSKEKIIDKSQLGFDNRTDIEGKKMKGRERLISAMFKFRCFHK
jgi:hypothetical protein